MAIRSGCLLALFWLAPHFSFPQGPVANEQIVLRWLHLVAGIIWIGLLYFFYLVNRPVMQEIEGTVRVKVYPVLMARAMWWFRWSALVTVIVGLRYFFMILAADAQNAGNPSLVWRWLGGWFATWLVAYVILYPLQMPAAFWRGKGWLRGLIIAALMIAASWMALDLNADPHSSNSHLSISVGGGLGLILLLNVWGVVWRAQKRLIAWQRAFSEHGTPIPPQAERLAAWALTTMRVSFWLSFPLLFFMGAADHYPFLSGIVG